MARTAIFPDIVPDNSNDIPFESLFQFVARIHNTESALRFCVSRKLIPNSRRCLKCGKTMTCMTRSRAIDGLYVSLILFNLDLLFFAFSGDADWTVVRIVARLLCVKARYSSKAV